MKQENDSVILKNYEMLKGSPNYKLLNSNMAEQILKDMSESFKSFVAIIRFTKNGEYDFDKIKLPHYLPKDEFTTMMISFVRIKHHRLTIPYSNPFRKDHQAIEITIPSNVMGKKIKEIRISLKVMAGSLKFNIHMKY